MSLFGNATSVRARAIYLGERIDVRAFETTERLAIAPLVIRAGDRGVAVLFRYGAVVLFHVQPLEEAGVVEHLKRYVGDPFPKPEVEEIEIKIGVENLEAGALCVADLSVERMQVIGEILARSVVLARSEGTVRETMATVETWARAVEQTGASGSLERRVRKHLASTLLTQNTLAGRIEIGDKPDVLWDHPELERLFVRLEDEYELRERSKTLDRKLSLLSSNAELLLDIVQTKHSNRLEWYIIVLILFEIALTLFTMFTSSTPPH